MYGTYLGREKVEKSRPGEWRCGCRRDGPCVFGLRNLYADHGERAPLCCTLRGSWIKSPAELAELLVPVLGWAARMSWGSASLARRFPRCWAPRSARSCLMLDGPGLPCGLDQKVTRFLRPRCCCSVQPWLYLRISLTRTVVVVNRPAPLLRPLWQASLAILLVMRRDIGAEPEAPEAADRRYDRKLYYCRLGADRQHGDQAVGRIGGGYGHCFYSAAGHHPADDPFGRGGKVGGVMDKASAAALNRLTFHLFLPLLVFLLDLQESGPPFP